MQFLISLLVIFLLIIIIDKLQGWKLIFKIISNAVGFILILTLIFGLYLVWVDNIIMPISYHVTGKHLDSISEKQTQTNTPSDDFGFVPVPQQNTPPHKNYGYLLPPAPAADAPLK